MLLVGDLVLVVEVFGAQSLELLTGVLFAFCGGVVIAQSTSRCQYDSKRYPLVRSDIRFEATDLVSLLIRCESLHFGVMFVC